MAPFFKMRIPDVTRFLIEENPHRIESMGYEGCFDYANGEYPFLEKPLLAKFAISLRRLPRL